MLKAWLRSLVTMVEAGRLSADAIRRTVLPFALAQGEAARPVVSRMVCCHVLGAAAAGYGEAGGICEQGTVAHALALCQDTEACPSPSPSPNLSPRPSPSPSPSPSPRP